MKVINIIQKLIQEEEHWKGVAFLEEYLKDMFPIFSLESTQRLNPIN